MHIGGMATPGSSRRLLLSPQNDLVLITVTSALSPASIFRFGFTVKLGFRVIFAMSNYAFFFCFRAEIRVCVSCFTCFFFLLFLVVQIGLRVYFLFLYYMIIYLHDFFGIFFIDCGES